MIQNIIRSPKETFKVTTVGRMRINQHNIERLDTLNRTWVFNGKEFFENVPLKDSESNSYEFLRTEDKLFRGQMATWYYFDNHSIYEKVGMTTPTLYVVIFDERCINFYSLTNEIEQYDCVQFPYSLTDLKMR